jgi:hypothetical protein
MEKSAAFNETRPDSFYCCSLDMKSTSKFTMERTKSKGKLSKKQPDTRQMTSPAVFISVFIYSSN